MIRIRNNLQAHAVHNKNGVLYYDVTDPQTNNTVRLYDIEWELASQLQGEISLATLQQWMNTTYGYTPNPADLTVFFQHLRSFGWVQEPTPASMAPIPPPVGSVPLVTPTREDVSAHDVQPKPSGGTTAVPPASMPAPVAPAPAPLPTMAEPVSLPSPVVTTPAAVVQRPTQPPSETSPPNQQSHALALPPIHKPLSSPAPLNSAEMTTPTKSWVSLLTLLLLFGNMVLLLVLLFVSASRP